MAENVVNEVKGKFAKHAMLVQPAFICKIKWKKSLLFKRAMKPLWSRFSPISFHIWFCTVCIMKLLLFVYFSPFFFFLSFLIRCVAFFACCVCQLDSNSNEMFFVQVWNNFMKKRSKIRKENTFFKLMRSSHDNFHLILFVLCSFTKSIVA